LVHQANIVCIKGNTLYYGSATVWSHGENNKTLNYKLSEIINKLEKIDLNIK